MEEQEQRVPGLYKLDWYKEGESGIWMETEAMAPPQIGSKVRFPDEDRVREIKDVLWDFIDGECMGFITVTVESGPDTMDEDQQA